MKIMQLEDAPLVRGLEHRGGTFHSRTMAEGTPGTPGNFKFSLSWLGTDYSGPRHRHNFDQYRFMIEGESDYGQDGPLKAGMLGYYPEGVPYGPQVNKTDIFCAVLQFGGASGSGYLLPREVKAGMEELKKFGEFKDGIFHRNDDVARPAQLRRLPGDLGAHARPRDGLSEGPLRRADLCGFEELRLGAGERREGRVREAVRRMDGAAHRSRPAQARGGREPHGRRAAASIWCCPAPANARASRCRNTPRVFLETGETTTLSASETMELLHYGLPDLSDMDAAVHTSGVAMQAAE